MVNPLFKHTSALKELSKTDLFSAILAENKDRIYWLIRKMVLVHEDANDITQDVFLKVWKNLDLFKGDSQYHTWIHRIAVNESLTFLEKKKRKYAASELNKHLFESLQSDAYFNGDEEIKKLHKALLTLPNKQRLVFNLKYFDNKKYSEISEITETSEGALKASYHLAVKKITSILKNED